MSPPIPWRPPGQGRLLPPNTSAEYYALVCQTHRGTNAGYRVSPFRFPKKFEPQEGTQSLLASWHRGGKALGFGPRPRDLPASLLFLLLGSTQAPQEQSGRRFRSPAARHAHRLDRVLAIAADDDIHDTVSGANPVIAVITFHLRKDPTVASKRGRRLPPSLGPTQAEGVVPEPGPRGCGGRLYGMRGNP